MKGGEIIPCAPFNKLAKKIVLNALGERLFAERVGRVIGMSMMTTHRDYMKGLGELERWVEIE